ncbi:universal stress protein [Halomicrobium salinisoli]|uniref:universal stress protein n=1 Tax=Halomicrobium salinisoli TaxID=2878391 RepID=UPI001CF0901D|nr:universal stress protein [Halomicrobium salinisoli]
MGQRILVPVDGSEQAERAVEFVTEHHPDATILLLHVINPAEAGYSAEASVPSFSEEWYEQEKARAERLFDELESAADATGTVVERAVEVGRPTTAIVDYADEHDVDQIVMGSHGRSGVSRILLGSVAETVVRRASVPVTVAR